ncbi:hypothetical protein [Streptacidiphilus sp. EB129]|uniref:hypothetical protein n=1 Tax=Streptacidiphilus sp. EB129 TaxID=3156262 RepID=UPI003511B09C
MSNFVPRSQAIQRAAQILAETVRQQAEMTPRQQAEAAWYPGHPLGSIEAIEQAVIERRQRHASLIARRDSEQQVTTAA